MNAQLPRTASWLCARLGELADRLARLDNDARRSNQPLVQDFADQAIQRQNDEVIDRLRAVTELELDNIDAALARIAAGAYGQCERCSRPIDPARLKALPQSILCAQCAQIASS